jgi:hypothetical protein
VTLFWQLVILVEFATHCGAKSQHMEKARRYREARQTNRFA